jgi:hypothetical protein
MENQYPETVNALRPQIERARAFLATGRRPSEIANFFHAEGLSALEILVVFREATGASLADLKACGQWWGALGVTDEAAFDEWAAEVLSRSRA